MLLQDIKELGLTQDLLDLIPENCIYCRCPLDVNEVLTRYVCLNPYCKGKLQSRLITFANELGISDLDKTAYIDLVDYDKFQKVSDLFFEDRVLDFIDYARNNDKPLLLKALNLLLVNLGSIKANLDLEAYIKCLGLPYMDNLRLRYVNTVELYKCLDSALTIGDLQVGLGMRNTSSTEVINIWLSLLGYRSEVEKFELLSKKM